MSLKAKIEAVIYASEEPVTLAQLMGLLGQEAQAELDRIESAQQSLALDSEAASTPWVEVSAENSSPSLQTEAAQLGYERNGSEDPPPDTPEIAPQPTDSPPGREPEPTEDALTHEHHQARADSAPTTASLPERNLKQDDKGRERRLREYFRSIVFELIAGYATSDRGLEVREVAGGFRFGTKPEYHDAVRGFVKSLKPPLKLSLQALETLAVVAYKQPVTAPEISEIRGVDSGGVLGSLMARKLITTAGRKQVIGRPILYKTTRDFLLRFGLKDVSELPSIEEFEKMAGELADTFSEPVAYPIAAYPIQEEIPMSSTTQTRTHTVPESPEDLEAQKGEVEPQADGDSAPLAGTDESSSGLPGTTVATPEGDNEFASDQPLESIEHGHQKPPAIDTNNL